MHPLFIPHLYLPVVAIITMLIVLLFVVYGFYTTYKRKLALGFTKKKAIGRGIFSAFLFYLILQIVIPLFILPIRWYILDFAIMSSDKFDTIPKQSLFWINKTKPTESVKESQYILFVDNGKLLTGVVTKNEGETLLVAKGFPLSSTTPIVSVDKNHIFGKIIMK